MKKAYRKIVEINNGFVKLHDMYGTILEGIPNMVAWIVSLVAFSNRFAELETICQQRTVGDAKLKKRNRGVLMERIRVIFSRISQWALTQDDDKLYGKCMDGLHGLSRVTDVGLKALCEGCFQIAEGCKDSWEQIGITQEMIDGMVNAEELYVATITDPQDLEQDIVGAHAEMEKNYLANKEVVYKRIVPTLNYELKDSHEEVLTVTKSILKADSITHRILAVRGQIVDVDSGDPVCYPVIEIKAIGLKRRLRSNEGRFTIANLEPGEYVLLVRREGYEDVEVHFVHAFGIRNELLIEMRAKVVAGVE